MKKYVFILIQLLFCMVASAQDDAVTTNFSPTRHTDVSNNQSGALASVSLTPYYTYVTIEVKPSKNLKRLNFWTGSNCRVQMGGKNYPLLGVLIDNDVQDSSYGRNWGWNDVKKNQTYYYTLVFAGRSPEGVTDFSLIDDGSGAHGYSFRGYTINNPRLGKYNVKNNKAEFEEEAKPFIIQNNDPICGIYEQIGSNGYRLAVIKPSENTYAISYIDDKEHLSWWHPGDWKAILEPSATPGAFKGTWIMANKRPNTDCFVTFDGASMTVYMNGEDKYIKMFPNANTSVAGTSQSSQPNTSAQQKNIWTGTGWALKNNYVVTNYHVIDGAKSIAIKGVNGDYTISHSATVIASDKFNDLAILRLNNGVINSESIPYSVITSTAEVGEEVFVLGYPMTSTMGDEIKLTTGVVSSRTGFQGDVSIYQISAPIQPGNSGGPLFDSNGNVIGIVSAKHQGAENVGYAIKTSYLKNLMESVISENVFPQTNRYTSTNLSSKVKTAKTFVYYIVCSDKEDGTLTDTSVSGKVFNNPTVTKADAINPVLKSVEIRNNQTILTFQFTNGVGHEPVSTVFMDPKAFITANGQKYYLTDAQGIAISPNMTYFINATQSITYKLIFPAIPIDTREIDFVESSDSDWNLYGIQLNR